MFIDTVSDASCFHELGNVEFFRGAEEVLVGQSLQRGQFWKPEIWVFCKVVLPRPRLLPVLLNDVLTQSPIVAYQYASLYLLILEPVQEVQVYKLAICLVEVVSWLNSGLLKFDLLPLCFRLLSLFFLSLENELFSFKLVVWVPGRQILYGVNWLKHIWHVGGVMVWAKPVFCPLFQRALIIFRLGRVFERTSLTLDF